MKRLRGVILFTAIELLTLIVWLVLAGVPFALTARSILAVAVLAIGLFIEHFVSVNVGLGRPPFSRLD